MTGGRRLPIQGDNPSVARTVPSCVPMIVEGANKVQTCPTPLDAIGADGHEANLLQWSQSADSTTLHNTPGADSQSVGRGFESRRAHGAVGRWRKLRQTVPVRHPNTHPTPNVSKKTRIGQTIVCIRSYHL